MIIKVIMLILDNLQMQKGDKKRINVVLGSCPKGSYSPIHMSFIFFRHLKDIVYNSVFLCLNGLLPLKLH